MFVFDTNRIPATTEELAAAITTGLCRKIHLADVATPVTLEGELPRLHRMTVDVTNGRIDADESLPDPTPPAQTEPGPTADSLVIRGNPVFIADIPVEFDLSAQQVAFDYARNGRGQLIATPRDASHGQLSVQLDHDHLESAILLIAQKLAATSGVAVSKASATLTSVSPTSVDVLLNITAKKLVTAMLHVSGRLSVNDRMVATATNLKAQGDGMVGQIAVKFLQPHLQKLNGQPLPLLALPLGNVKLRQIQVETERGLRIAAAFGSE